MKTALVTGSAGLVGSATVRLLASEGYAVVGIDNDMRSVFFGEEGSTAATLADLQASLPEYVHHDVDIRNHEAVQQIFENHGSGLTCVVHTAAQPSHDWAASDPLTDFDVNARATLQLLQATREHCPDASFVYTSTNKVYGDTPNRLPLVEQETRWEIERDHPFFEHGIDESMSVDRTTHSLFGASKLAADILVQEYGEYYGMNTACFRAGCITGSTHAGVPLHGFLSYLIRCLLGDTEYSIFGYKGKQVRDNIHAEDLATMFLHYLRSPRPARVYNAGGGRRSHCSLLEAVEMAERITGRKLKTRYVPENRRGDHIWYVSDTRAFEKDYPQWTPLYDLEKLMVEICEGLVPRISN